MSFATAQRRVPGQVVLVGQTRITEALARFLAQLEVPTRLLAPRIEPADLPATVTCACGGDDGRPLDLPAGAAVVVGSHLPADPRFVREALAAGASYVAMVGSRTRALEVLGELGLAEGDRAPGTLHIPAGLDIDARTPEEIALSIVAEMAGPGGDADG